MPSSAPLAAAPPRVAVQFVIPVAAVTIASQFFRTSTGVIGPELVRDLSLSPRGLGFGNGAFFVAFLISQIPVGMAFDRIGPRRTVSALGLVTVLGALLQAAAASEASFVLARFLVGLGCAASFMSAVVLCARWFDGARFTTVLSAIFALSSAGYVLASTPWAMLVERAGWRPAFVVSAVGAALTTAVFWIAVRDSPRPIAASRPESLREIAGGLREVWRLPGLAPILAMHFVAYASILTVLSLWAGPYLHDVHRLDPVPRGNVLLGMAMAGMLGTLAYGPLDRRFNTRKGVVVAGAVLSAVVMAALALVPDPRLDASVALLVLLSFVSSYSVVIVAHGKSLFPPHLIGRGVTTVNLAQVVGCAALPVVTGLVVSLFPSPGGTLPEIAYRVAFGLIAATVVVALAFYTRSRDARPNP